MSSDVTQKESVALCKKLYRLSDNFDMVRISALEARKIADRLAYLESAVIDAGETCTVYNFEISASNKRVMFSPHEDPTEVIDARRGHLRLVDGSLTVNNGRYGDSWRG